MKDLINKYGHPEAVIFSNNKNYYYLIWEFEDTFQINNHELFNDNVITLEKKSEIVFQKSEIFRIFEKCCNFFFITFL